MKLVTFRAMVLASLAQRPALAMVAGVAGVAGLAGAEGLDLCDCP